MGIDVGARRLDVVVLDRDARVRSAGTFPARDPAAVAGAIAPAAAVAIDAPDGWSRAPHAADTTLPPKFRSARCGEISLGRQYRLWVPWTTPCDPTEAPAWIHAGIGLFAALRDGGRDPIEVYPHAAFRVLNRFAALPPKRTAAGRACRQQLLAEAGVGDFERLGDSHDLLDAAAAALVALHRRRGLARPVSCGHDTSAIWLPAPGTRDSSPPGVPEAAGTPFRA